jgi:hypothetical protein
MTIRDQETISWYSADAPPDDDTTVLIFAPGTDEPVWLGYHQDGIWYAVMGDEYPTNGSKVVTAWAPMPTGVRLANTDLEDAENERAYERQQQRLMEDGPDTSIQERQDQELRDAGRGHLVR